MCQIQIIQKLGKEKINKGDLGEFFKLMCFGSIDNHDAFGVFNHNYMFKQKGAFDASKIEEYSLVSDNFIIGHNRYSTSWTKIKSYEKPLPKLSQSKKTSRPSPKTWNHSKNFLDNMSHIFLATYPIGILPQNYVEEEEDQEEKDSLELAKKISSPKDYDKNRNHHPFKIGDFLLIHNGVISNAQALQEEYNFNTPISTDSYIILELIDYY